MSIATQKKYLNAYPMMHQIIWAVGCEFLKFVYFLNSNTAAGGLIVGSLAGRERQRARALIIHNS
jgi:hypothetical protein